MPPVFTPLRLDFNFGAAPLKAQPSVVLLVLKNSGMVPLDWYGWPEGLLEGGIGVMTLETGWSEELPSLAYERPGVCEECVLMAVGPECN
jgi:hypothetical protein